MKFDLTFEKVNNTELLVMRPCEEMTDATYDNLKQYIEGMGGHWRERVRGFAFFVKALKRDHYKRWKELNQFFPTPDKIAEELVELSGIDTWRETHDNVPIVLEPSAGDGALLKAIQSNVAHITYVVEPEENNIKALEELGYEVNKCTFEDFYKQSYNKGFKVTHVIMNPPFSKSRDVKHVMMAYNLLDKGGRLVAIVSENSLYYANESSQKFKKWLNEHRAIIKPINTGSFKDSGTMVDTVIIVLNKE